MAATGSRRKDIWSPVGEQENSDEKEESLDLMAPKTLVNPFEVKLKILNFCNNLLCF